MNTAKMREKAKLYEARLDWHNAALCWADAIALLSNVDGINALDRKNMEDRRAACENMAKQELKEHCRKLVYGE